MRASSHKHCHHPLEFPGNPGRVINHLVWLLPPQTLAKGSTPTPTVGPSKAATSDIASDFISMAQTHHTNHGNMKDTAYRVEHTVPRMGG